MKKFMMGKKIGMTQVFDENDLCIPVTVIEAGPCTVIQMKTVESDGYSAVKVGFFAANEKRLSKPQKGIFSKLKVSPKKFVREFRIDEGSYEVGQEINITDMFKAGDKVDISGISKGKGFQGTIKRFGQTGGPETHGSMYHRRPGSMGSNTSPARVFKGR